MTVTDRIFFFIFFFTAYFQLGSNIHEENDFQNISSTTENKNQKYKLYYKVTPSFKFIPPELEMKYLYLKMNDLSTGTLILPEFSNHYNLLGGIILHSAVENNNLNLIENLIDIKSDLNIEDIDGVTPLYKALKKNNVDVIEMLTDAGADINFISSEGNSLLQTSIMDGDFDLFEKLIDLGVIIDALNKDNLTALYKASEISNQQMIATLLNKNANVNFENSLGQSLLSVAVHKGRLDVVKQLIQSGAKIDKYDNNWETPLYTALKLNYPGIIRVLLDNGANPSAVSARGYTLLHTAVLEGQLDVIQKLIVVGANVSALDGDSLTALCLAIKINNTDAIKTMIENNVDINERCHGLGKEFPLHFAVTNGSVESIKVLLDGGAKTSVLNYRGLTPLVLAILKRKETFIELLKNFTHSVNYKVDQEGNTPLHLAVSKEDLWSAEKLLELGAEVDSMNKKGLTPLCKAAQTKNKNIIILLQKNGANINFQNAFGDTPIHLAVANKSIATIIQLIELGAKVDYTNRKGLTPLCKAILMNATNIVNVLLVKGANVNFMCNQQSPYLLTISNSTLSTLKRLINLGATTNESYASLSQVAVKADNPEIMNYLLNKSNNISTKWQQELLFLAASSGSSKVLRDLITLGLSVEIISDTGLSPLWNATMNNKINTMEIILENGGYLNKTINYSRDGLWFYNWTLLHEAAFNGEVRALELLLKFGMNTEVKDSRKWTPLHYAAAQHNVAVINKLVVNGANIKAKTNRGEQPVDLLKHRQTYKPIIIEWLTTGKISTTNHSKIEVGKHNSG